VYHKGTAYLFAENNPADEKLVKLRLRSSFTGFYRLATLQYVDC